MTDSCFDDTIEEVEGIIEFTYAGPGWMEEGKFPQVSVIAVVVDSLDDSRIGDKTEFVQMGIGVLPGEESKVTVDKNGLTASQRYCNGAYQRMGVLKPLDEWRAKGFQEDKQGDGPFVTWCKSLSGKQFYGIIGRQVFEKRDGTKGAKNTIKRVARINGTEHKRFIERQEARGNETPAF